MSRHGFRQDMLGHDGYDAKKLQERRVNLRRHHPHQVIVIHLADCEILAINLELVARATFFDVRIVNDVSCSR